MEERNRRDAERDKLENPLEKHKQFEGILKAKADEYDRILRGEEELPGEYECGGIGGSRSKSACHGLTV